jgi:hypothetical protein
MMERASSIMSSKRILLFNQYFHRFQKWWNMSVEEIMEKDEKPPVPQEPATGAPAVKK